MYGGGVIYRLVHSFGSTDITHSNDTVTLAWNAFTNGVYRVEVAGSLPCTNWAALSPEVISTGTTARFTWPAQTNSPGFYRITLLPGGE
jgi:hypothetical protein